MLDIDREQGPEALRLACRADDKAKRRLVETIQRLTREAAERQGLDAEQVTLELPRVTLPAPTTTEVSDPTRSEESSKQRPHSGHGPTPQLTLPKAATRYRCGRDPDREVCGGTMRAMEGQFEDSEEITVLEPTYEIGFHRVARSTAANSTRSTEKSTGPSR